MNIYKTCPDVHNERFRLRLVTQEDCEDLLKVYSDVKAVPLFNGDKLAAMIEEVKREIAAEKEKLITRK